MIRIILANLGSLGAMICDSYSGTRKSKKDILWAQTASQFFYLASAIILQTYSAAAQNLVAIFRNVYGAGNNKNLILDWVFVISPVALGLFLNNQGALGLVPIFANLQYALVVLVLKGKPRAIKTSFAICCSAFIFFNFAVKNYVGTVSCVVVVATTVLSLIKDKGYESIVIDGRCYYEAYDERYKAVHKLNKSWFSEKETRILDSIISKYVNKEDKILEIGCGEGRDSKYLLDLGYNVLATDVSEEAISYCKTKSPKYENNFGVLDAVKGEIKEKYNFIYAISVIHMLTEDSDRSRFLNTIKNGLSSNGYALICSMGDGNIEINTKPEDAFSIIEREHADGEKLLVAQTSCRVKKIDDLEKELSDAGFSIIDKGVSTNEPDYDNLIWFVVQ